MQLQLSDLSHIMNGGDTNIDHDDKWDFINRQLKHLESFTLDDPPSSPSGTNVDPPFLPASSSTSSGLKNYRKSEGDLPRKESPDFGSIMTTAALPPQSAPVINSTAAANDFYWLNTANILESHSSGVSTKARANSTSKDVNSTNHDNHLTVSYMHPPPPTKASVHERSKSDSASSSAAVVNQLTSSMKSNVSSSSNSPISHHHHQHSPNFISSPSSPSLSHHHSPLVVQHNLDTELPPTDKYHVNDNLTRSLFLRNTAGGTIPRKLSNEMKRKQLSPINRRKSAPLSDSVQIKSVPRRAFSQTKFASSGSPRGTPPASDAGFAGLSKEDSLQKVNEIFSSPELIDMFEDEPKDEDYTRGNTCSG